VGASELDLSLRASGLTMLGEARERSMTTAPILIKRYARSRLYDATRGRYVSVEELRQWRKEGVRFIVRDAETGTDVTRVLLA
jgi:polyhydroxyalkanoate synthesis regulator protein